MPSMKSLRVRGEAIHHPAVRNLIEGAVRAVEYPGTSPHAFYEEIASNIKTEALGVFIGAEDTPVFGRNRLRALCVGSLPTSQIMMQPQIYLAYSTHPKAARAVGEMVRAWLKSAGYAKALTINLRITDRAFMRVFAHAGKARVIGSAVEFEI